MVEHMMDVRGWLREQLEGANPDLLRATVKDFAEALMGAEAEALCAPATGALTGAGQPPQRLPGAGLGHARGVDRARGPQAARGLVFP